MEKALLQVKIDNLLDDLKTFVEAQALSDQDMSVLRSEIDKLLYECLYYKSKLVS